IHVDQDKGRTGNRIERSPTLGKPLCKGGLAGSEIALQTNDIASLQHPAEAYADAARLLGTAAEKFQHMFVQNSHGVRIIPPARLTIRRFIEKNPPDTHRPRIFSRTTLLFPLTCPAACR